MGYAGPTSEGARVRIVDEEFRSSAAGAKVTMSYRVWQDPCSGAETYRTALTLAKASTLLRQSKGSSMQVLFRWRLGDKEGDGCVSYIREDHPTATDRFIERITRRLIERAIAEDLAAGRFVASALSRGTLTPRNSACGA